MSISPTAKMSEGEKISQLEEEEGEEPSDKIELENNYDDGPKLDNKNVLEELCISRTESEEVNCKSHAEKSEGEAEKSISYEEKSEDVHNLDKMQSFSSESSDESSDDDVNRTEISREGDEFKAPKLEPDDKIELQGAGDEKALNEFEVKTAEMQNLDKMQSFSSESSDESSEDDANRTEIAREGGEFEAPKMEPDDKVELQGAGDKMDINEFEVKTGEMHNLDKMQSFSSESSDESSDDDVNRTEISREGDEFKAPKLEPDDKIELQGDGDKMDMNELVPETQDLKLNNLDKCNDSGNAIGEIRDFDSEALPETNQEDSNGKGKELDSASEGEEATETEGVVDKATALKNFVKEKSVVAVSSLLRRLSGKGDEIEKNIYCSEDKGDLDPDKDSKSTETSQKNIDKSIWNPLSYIKISRDVDEVYKKDEAVKESPTQLAMRGRILLYTRLGCQECKEARLFFYYRKLRYVEINIDIYPSRKLELDKISGSSSVPKVFFNEILIGGLNELRNLDASGKLNEKIEYLIAESPSREAPLPPLSGEDDVSNSGTVDELALIVQKMKESIPVKDRFSKFRKFSQCFSGSDAVNFLSEDQYLEREEAVEFGRKLAKKLFFQNVIGENLFEDGNHLYRFLDDDPIISSQCHNIPRGIIDVKPKPLTDIASRLRFLSFAIFESYVSEDGKHVDYRSIHGSEEFARYLRIVEELQRVEVPNMSREEKLAFFMNLYNMMGIHAILVCGHPSGALERRKLFGEFKYVVGGSPYSLSDIQNGILRGNQRPPYTLTKPFSAKDKRSKAALPYVEPLIHFALVSGTRSGPGIQCYSPGNIDKELMEAARSFLRGGGLLVDSNASIASVSQILKWFSMDFGKNETEVLKHASNYLEPEDAQALLEMIANAQLKVTYQPYDWDLNC